MNKLCTLTLLFLIFAFHASGQYITVWNTTNAGESGNDQVTIPATGTNYDIVWEEVGVPSNNGGVTGVSGNYTIQFPTAGIYQVSITPGSGTFTRIAFGPDTDYRKLLEIRQWGNIQWESMENAYASCNNMTVTATDIPDLRNVTSMHSMFASCYAVTGLSQANSWDVSTVTDMAYMFASTHFNDPIDNWNVSNVTNMEGMFFNSYFNQPIGNWTVGNVTNMSYMFDATETFNQPIGSWDVSNVTNMGYMFAVSQSFNQPIDEWETGSVVNMRSMFAQAAVFNQPIGSWDVSNVTDMQTMFRNTVFNQPIGDWEVGNVATMSNMFYLASAFNQPIGGWNVGNVTDMRYMFFGASAFNQPIGTWNMGNVTITQFMLAGAGAFNQPVNDWDLSNVADLSFMFYGAVSFNQPVNGWILSGATNLLAMFFQATSFNQPVNDWDVSQATNLSGVFAYASAFNQPLDNWTLSSVTDMTSILAASGTDCVNMSLTLIGWAANTATSNNIIFGAEQIDYGPPAAEALETLRLAKNWTITIGNEVICEALEVTLISFNAKSTGGQVQLEWATASETDNDYFEVERSADMHSWNAVGKIDGAGTVTSVRNYTLVDSAPLEGTSYYRLRIIDFAGKADYSNIKAVNRKMAPTINVYPNPATTSLTLSGKAGGYVEIYNLSGRQVVRKEIKAEKTVIPLSELPAGAYLIKSNDGWNSKFIKN
ncbi:BspA family leucine-rich repeat surface protein [Dyadobacter sp. CY347]|uniref:BspA family leucine-rich repeat surface protein n=1 Tax=Dyadobacter sp. CY347 TaxID=2909336 RepID=UPI001F295B69|nr:BspA family leucine-rich repeat surface protein [Dyadobacter sp. CY347]MCF2487716.1 BspA family leucine-rich repeat surface protein [Dyadobacter sp. CY347]